MPSFPMAMFPKHYRRLVMLVGVLALVAFGLVVISCYDLYLVSLQEHQTRLREFIQGRARVMEAIVQHKQFEHQADVETASLEALGILRDARWNLHNQRETVEFVVGRRTPSGGFEILDPNLQSSPQYRFGPNSDDERAEPMRQALSGMSGAMIAIDYQGEPVVAAYEPVQGTPIGLVAKVDVAEIRRPFFFHAMGIGLVAAVIVALATVGLVRVAAPMMQAEVDLKHNEEFFRSLIELSPAVYAVVNQEGVVTYESPTVRALLGRDPEEVVGGSAFANIHPADVPKAREAFASIIQAPGAIESVELRCQHVDGSFRWLSVVAANCLHLSGVNGVLLSMHDLTELKHAEDNLRKTLSEFEQVFDAASPMAVIGLDYRLIKANRRFAGLLGKSPEDCVGEHCHDLISGPACGGPQCCMRAADQNCEIVKEASFAKPDGSEVTCMSKAFPFRNDHGETVGVVNSITDITKLKAAEEAMRRSERQYRTLYQSSPDAVLLLSPDNRFQGGNRAATSLFGVENEQQLQGVHPAELSPLYQPDGVSSIEASRGHIQRAVDHGGCSFRWVHRRRNGEEFPCSVLLTRMVVDDETFVQATVRDISEQERTKATLAQKEKELVHAQKMEAIGSLAGGMAHEFNNLLQAIRGYVQLAIDDLEPDHAVQDDLTEVMAASERAMTLTREILNFSRQEDLSLEQVDAAKLLGDVVKILKPVIGEHIELQIHRDENVGSVLADRTMLQQALMNLCINARDAMPKGGRLSLRADHLDVTAEYAEIHPEISPGPHVRFTVTDTGCGMSPEVQRRIFEPFYTTKDLGQGTGLGLAMVYSLVQQHQGSVHVYSEVGQGTTFKVCLPASLEKTREKPPAASASAVGGSELVLVAEDEPTVRNVAVRFLERAGYRTLVAENGAQAVELFQEHAAEIDIVLSDVIMPKLNGHEAAEHMQLIKPGVKIVFCTGYDSCSAQTEFMAGKAIPMIEKPYSQSMLLDTVRRVLDGNYEAASCCCR